MATSYYTEDEDWYGDWVYEEVGDGYAPVRRPLPIDVVLLAAVALVLAGMVLGLSRITLDLPAAANPPAPRQEERAVEEAPAAPLPHLSGAEVFVMPYSEYMLTQGPHGMSYGHYAIDLAAGNGEPVLSPINGRVSQLYVDGIGNPTLVLENEAYTVTMLHGRYSVQVGQEVSAGEQVGTESNKGNTRDMNGNSCRNRDCGYHTHLNVFSKAAGQNVNPLELLSR